MLPATRDTAAQTPLPDPCTFPSLFDDPADPAVNGFAALGLPVALTRALALEGIRSPFPIQTATVPDALAGRDVLGRGQTGSGKTLAFGLPLLARLSRQPHPATPRRPRALILVPTRELAMQVHGVLAPLARTLGLACSTAVGGVGYGLQIPPLERGVEVLVATPGRLGDLIERGACALDGVEITVLDEADQMADMGFLPEVTELMGQTPTGGQRMLYSATLDDDVDELVKRFLTDPVRHEVDPPMAPVDAADHHVLLVPPREKIAVTTAIAARQGRTMLFVKTQVAVDELVEQLGRAGVRAGALHGGKTQRVRSRVLSEFRDGAFDALVATDVAARGLHVDGVSLVVHVDPPRDSKDYLHRAGRTARAGATGTVVTLVMPRQRKRAAAILTRSGVRPREHRVRLGDPRLAEVTGARQPVHRHHEHRSIRYSAHQPSGNGAGRPFRGSDVPVAQSRGSESHGSETRGSDARDARTRRRIRVGQVRTVWRGLRPAEA